MDLGLPWAVSRGLERMFLGGSEAKKPHSMEFKNLLLSIDC